VTTNDFLDEPPGGASMTAYDEAHVRLYLRLLDAEAQGADWTEVVETIFGISPTAEPDRAAKVHQAHMGRAKFMTRNGFCEFLGSRAH